MAPATELGGDPDPLDLAGLRGGGADLRLEDDLAVVDPGEGAAGAYELGDAGLVEEAAVARERRDADLFGEHVDAGRHQDVDLVLADAADQRVGGHVGRRALGDHERLVGPDLAGRAPARFEEPPQLCGGPGRAHDRGAAAARPAGAVGEGPDGLGGGADGDEVGARVAERAQAAVRVPAPHLAAEAPGVEARDLDPGGHEGVGYGFALQHRKGGAEVAGFEDPGGGLRQHEGASPYGLLISALYPKRL